MTKNIRNIKLWQKRTKERLIKAFNNKCGICGYNRCDRALGFHHLDPKEKKFSISSLTKSWKNLVIEARKCILVCSNCHMEIHSGLIEIPDNITRFNESFSEYTVKYKKDMFDLCPVCGKSKLMELKTCSVKCRDEIRYRINWNDIDIIKMYEDIGTYVGVGKILGVSDNTVKKRINIKNKT